MPDSSPFGQKKVAELISILERYDAGHKLQFEYQLGLGILNSWHTFFLEQGWNEELLVPEVNRFLLDNNPSFQITAGYQRLANKPIQAYKSTNHEGYCLSPRKSVRDFMVKELD